VDIMAVLLAAIAAQPGDPDPQLVLADHLLAAGDPRGELIVLDHLERSTPGGLADPAALDRLLLLAATYGFPCARNDVEPMLPFERRGGYRVQYEVDYGEHHYYVIYRHNLRVTTDRGAIDSGIEHPYGLFRDLNTLESCNWTAEERREILTLLSDAIRAGTPLRELQFPYTDEALQQYPDAPMRAYWLPEPFVAAHGLSRDRHGLAARDYHRWHALWERLQRLPPPERDSAEAIADYTVALDLSWLAGPPPSEVKQTLLVSADRDLVPSEIDELATRYSAVAGDWESGAIAYTCKRNRQRVLILRGVSDLVDRAGGEAYGNTSAFAAGADVVMRRLLGELPAWLARCP
jgi:uncharacterized protein (TIGR02996 family)